MADKFNLKLRSCGSEVSSDSIVLLGRKTRLAVFPCTKYIVLIKKKRPENKQSAHFWSFADKTFFWPPSLPMSVFLSASDKTCAFLFLQRPLMPISRFHETAQKFQLFLKNWTQNLLFLFVSFK